MIGVLRLPDEVRFGAGVRVGIAETVLRFGPRVFVVADPFLATTPEFDETVSALRAAGAEVLVHTDVPPELPVGVVEEAGRTAAAFAPDVILGYGGGSALDAAKLIAVVIAHGTPLARFYGENAVPGPVLPIVAVPTTAGTGSEVTPVAVISDPQRELKVGVSSPYLIPRAAFVDPDLTIGAPRGVTVASGIDAFVHAVESYTAGVLELSLDAVLPVFTGRNVLTEPFSLEAAGLLFRALPRVVADPTDREARADMALGSLLAGIAFGSTGTHLSHAIQYPVGAMTKTPHGLGTGALLPYVLQALRPAIDDRLIAIGRAIGVLDDGTAGTRASGRPASGRPASGRPASGLPASGVEAQRVVDAVAELCAGIGLPVALSEIGVTEDDIARVTDLTLDVGRLVAISPRRADRPFIEGIVAAAVAGDRARLVPPVDTAASTADPARESGENR